MSIVNQQIKYIIKNIDRLSKPEIVSIFSIHLVQRGLKNYMTEIKGAVCIDFGQINDPDIINNIYNHTSHLCSKLD